MSRPYFESPLDFESAEPLKSARIPTWKILFVGVVAIGAVIGLAWMQLSDRSELAPPIQVLAAYDQAEREGKQVLLVFSDPAGADDQRMDEHAWKDARVKELVDKRYVVCRLTPSAQPYRELTQVYDVRKTPTVVVATPRGAVLRTPDGEPARRDGYIDPVTLRMFLDRPLAGVATADASDDG